MHRWFKTNQSSLVFSALLCLLVFLLMFGCVVGPKTEEHKQPVIIGHVKQHKQPVVGPMITSNKTTARPKHHKILNTSVTSTKQKKRKNKTKTFNPYKEARKLLTKKPDAAAYLLNSSNQPLFCIQTISEQNKSPYEHNEFWLLPEEHEAVVYVKVGNDSVLHRFNITGYYIVDVFHKDALGNPSITHYLLINQTITPVLPWLYLNLTNETNQTGEWNQSLELAVSNTSCGSLNLSLQWVSPINFALVMNMSRLQSQIISMAVSQCRFNSTNMTFDQFMTCPYARISMSVYMLLLRHEAVLYPPPKTISLLDNETCYTLRLGNQTYVQCVFCAPTDNLPTLPKTKPCSPIQYLTYVAQNLNQSKSSH